METGQHNFHAESDFDPENAGGPRDYDHITDRDEALLEAWHRGRLYGCAETRQRLMPLPAAPLKEGE